MGGGSGEGCGGRRGETALAFPERQKWSVYMDAFFVPFISKTSQRHSSAAAEEKTKVAWG